MTGANNYRKGAHTVLDLKYQIERYFVCKNQLQYLEKPLKF